MTIRNKLRLSHMAMVLIPIFFSVIVTLIIGHFYIKDLETAYNFKFKRKTTFEQFMDRRSTPLFINIRNTSRYEPQKFENLTYVKKLDTNLAKIHSGIVIRKNRNIIYASNFINVNDIKDTLPKFAISDNPRFHPMIGNQLIKQFDFRYNDGSEGSAFIVTDITLIKKTILKFVIVDVSAIIAIMVITNALLTFFTSKSIVEPLETLKDGAIQIKNGNLEFEFKSSFNDEIGEVYSAFEEMRLKLKEHLDLQQQYENNRKELISNISHDLKTPITAIKGYIEGIMDGVANSPEKRDKYMKTINSKATDIERLIDELFLFSKLDLNKLPFNFEEINLKRYIEDCCEELKLDLEENNIDFEYHIENSDPEQLVIADREKLKRVITNIVTNSIKYMDKSTAKIQIKLQDFNEYLLIIIQDNGIGIGNDELPFIFDRFYRADQARNTSTGGSGLGLAISKLIIEELGGHIWAESKEGEGTSVFITLKKYNKEMTP